MNLNIAAKENNYEYYMTRIVSTVKGDVEIPAEPKRVAADQYMGHLLLKLGIVPVGARDFMLKEPWLELKNSCLRLRIWADFQ